MSGCRTTGHHDNGYEGTVDGDTEISAALRSRFCCRQHNGHQIGFRLFWACHVTVANLLILVFLANSAELGCEYRPTHEDLQSLCYHHGIDFQVFVPNIQYFNNCGITSVQYMNEMYESVIFVCSPPASLVWWWVTIVWRGRSLKGFTATDSFDLEYLPIMRPDLMHFWHSSDPDLFSLTWIL